MTKILICGDSFAADWTVKYDGKGWPNLLADKYDVTNLAQAGCSEYKIYKQVISADIDTYDFVIVSHTSPNRLYVDHHPIHHSDPLHHNCDLIYPDLLEHSKSNPEVKVITDYFEQYFNLEHATFVHNLIVKEIIQTLRHHPNVIHCTNLLWDYGHLFDDSCMVSTKIVKLGLLNHCSDQDNYNIYTEFDDIIDFCVKHNKTPMEYRKPTLFHRLITLFKKD